MRRTGWLAILVALSVTVSPVAAAQTVPAIVGAVATVGTEAFVEVVNGYVEPLPVYLNELWLGDASPGVTDSWPWHTGGTRIDQPLTFDLKVGGCSAKLVVSFATYEAEGYVESVGSQSGPGYVCEFFGPSSGELKFRVMVASSDSGFGISSDEGELVPIENLNAPHNPN